MRDTQKSPIISIDLRRIAEQAKDEPTKVFISLAHKMDENFLLEGYRQVRKEGAPGLSGVTAKDYAKDLSANLQDLQHQRLRSEEHTRQLKP